MEHPDSLDEYFRQPVAGKKRIHRLLDLMVERHTVQFFRFMYGEPDEMPVEAQDDDHDAEIDELALELARARALPGERVESADDLATELARVLAQDSSGFRKIESLRVSAPTMAWLLKLRQEHQERRNKEDQERLAAQRTAQG